MHIRLVFYGTWQVALSLVYVFAIGPIAILLWFLFSIARYLMRSFYDCITFIIVCCGARVPIRENNIAWRIKGKHLLVIKKKKIYIYIYICKKENRCNVNKNKISIIFLILLLLLLFIENMHICSLSLFL